MWPRFKQTNKKSPELSIELSSSPADLPLLYALALYDAPVSRPVMLEILTVAYKKNLAPGSTSPSIRAQLTQLCQLGIVSMQTDVVDLYSVSLAQQMGGAAHLAKRRPVAAMDRRVA